VRERDPVAPAKRSKAALGTPALSFNGLLKHPATIVRSTVRRRNAEPGEETFARLRRNGELVAPTPNISRWERPRNETARRFRIAGCRKKRRAIRIPFRRGARHLKR
jgi:hypothetical protein